MAWKIVQNQEGQHYLHRLNADGTMSDTIFSRSFAGADEANTQKSILESLDNRFLPIETELYAEFLEAKSFMEANPITGVTETPQGDIIIPMKSLRFTSPDEKDLKGEWFDRNTDFGHPAASEVVNAYLDHGKDVIAIKAELLRAGYNERDAGDMAAELGIGKQSIGAAIRNKVDEEAMYYNIIVSRRNRYKNLIKRLAEEKLVSQSSGVRFRSDPRADGYVERWHPVEQTFTPEPADHQLDVVSEEERSMPEENAANQTPPPEGQGQAVGDTPADGTTPTLSDQIRNKFAEARAKQTTPDETLSVLEKMVELNEKSTTSIIEAFNAKLDTLMGEIKAVAKQANETHQAMPVLVEEITKSMLPALAEEGRKTERERDLERSARDLANKGGNNNNGGGHKSIEALLPKNAPGVHNK